MNIDHMVRNIVAGSSRARTKGFPNETAVYHRTPEWKVIENFNSFLESNDIANAYIVIADYFGKKTVSLILKYIMEIHGLEGSAGKELVALRRKYTNELDKEMAGSRKLQDCMRAWNAENS